MKNKAKIHFRIDPEDYSNIKKLAKKDKRKMTQIVEIALRQYFVKRGLEITP